MKINQVIHGDNLDILREMPDNSIDLIYCDPPFLTGRDFGEYSDKTPETEKAEGIAFEYRRFQWLNGILTPKEKMYFSLMIPRLLEIYRVLRSTGALYWHCDFRTNSYMRILLDQIFGKPQYRNEIAWIYNTTQLFDSIKHRWKNNFDNILFYAKAEHNFEAQHYPLEPKKAREMYPYRDSDGRRYRHRNDASAHSLYDVREYADENKGTRIETAWHDIAIAGPKERSGYPTQKPIALLKRILRGSSKEGQLVLDPYCGSGTTLLTAKMLGRDYIGIDTNEEAVFIARKRLT